MSDNWRWEYGYEFSDEPIYRSSVDVLVPEETRTLEPFGFARALMDPPPEQDPIYSVFGATGISTTPDQIRQEEPMNDEEKTVEKAEHTEETVEKVETEESSDDDGDSGSSEN